MMRFVTEEISTPPVPRLSVPVEWMRFCPKCGSQQRFVATGELQNGLMGRCAGCDDETVQPWTRTMEAA